MTESEIRAAIEAAKADGSADAELERTLRAIAADLATPPEPAAPATIVTLERKGRRMKQDDLSASWRRRMELAAADYFHGSYFAAASQLEMLAADLRDFAAPGARRAQPTRRRR